MSARSSLKSLPSLQATCSSGIKNEEEHRLAVVAHLLEDRQDLLVLNPTASARPFFRASASAFCRSFVMSSCSFLRSTSSSRGALLFRGVDLLPSRH